MLLICSESLVNLDPAGRGHSVTSTALVAQIGVQRALRLEQTTLKPQSYVGSSSIHCVAKQGYRGSYPGIAFCLGAQKPLPYRCNGQGIKFQP